MPGGKDGRALTEQACVVSDASDSGIGAAEKEVGGSCPGTGEGGAVLFLTSSTVITSRGFSEFKDRVQEWGLNSGCPWEDYNVVLFRRPQGREVSAAARYQGGVLKP